MGPEPLLTKTMLHLPKLLDTEEMLIARVRAVMKV